MLLTLNNISDTNIFLIFINSKVIETDWKPIKPWALQNVKEAIED